MEIDLFKELIVVLALAVGIILLFRRLRLPGVLGFIVAGMIAGPHALGWADNVHNVEVLAELGVIFLLFKMRDSLPTEIFKGEIGSKLLGGAAYAGALISLLSMFKPETSR